MNDETTQESVKMINKGMDLAKSFGEFVAPLIIGSLEQAIGIFEDKLKYARWERQVRLMQRANKYMQEKGITVKNPIQLKHAIPLLQGASLEDDDILQDLWAKLLVNAVSDKGIELKRVYMDILERLSPLEAMIIEKIYDIPFIENKNNYLRTYKLPNYVEIQDEDNNEYPLLNNPEVELALINLDRLGCISPAMTLGGGEIYSIINLTHLGKVFHEACTL